MMNPTMNRKWQRMLSAMPAELRAVAEEYPMGSKWSLKSQLDDTRTYYMPNGVNPDGTLVMIRYLAHSGQAVQLWQRVETTDLVPFDEGHA